MKSTEIHADSSKLREKPCENLKITMFKNVFLFLLLSALIILSNVWDSAYLIREFFTLLLENRNDYLPFRKQDRNSSGENCSDFEFFTFFFFTEG